MFFNELPSHLATHFADGRRYLVIAGTQCFLAGIDAVFERQSGDGPAQFAVADLAELWSRLIQVVGDQSEFDQDELERLTRTDSTVLAIWRANGVLRPIKGTYDLTDVFAGVVCSVLRRKGVGGPVLWKAGRFVLSGHGEGVIK